MYNNIGAKIKGLAEVIFGLGVVVSVLGSVVWATSTSDGFSIGVLIAILIVAAIGSCLSWMASLAVYGFGEPIDNSRKILKKLNQMDQE